MSFVASRQAPWDGPDGQHQGHRQVQKNGAAVRFQWPWTTSSERSGASVLYPYRGQRQRLCRPDSVLASTYVALCRPAAPGALPRLRGLHAWPRRCFLSPMLLLIGAKESRSLQQLASALAVRRPSKRLAQGKVKNGSMQYEHCCERSNMGLTCWQTRSASKSVSTTAPRI